MLIFVYTNKEKQIIMTILINTKEKTKRVENSIFELKQKLTRELSFSEDLQKKERVNSLKSNIKRLKKDLKNGFIETTY